MPPRTIKTESEVVHFEGEVADPRLRHLGFISWDCFPTNMQNKMRKVKQHLVGHQQALLWRISDHNCGQVDPCLSLSSFAGNAAGN